MTLNVVSNEIQNHLSITYYDIGDHFKIIPEYFAISSFQENIGFSGFILNIGLNN